MPLALDLVKGGISPQTARSMGGQAQSSISAAGTNIATATDITASINVVTTAAASTGVQLPSAQIGDEVEILNLGANALTVYPDSTSNQINALTAGSGFLLATNTAVKLKKYTASRWMGFLSA